jgi:hypothetical protein
MPDQTANPAPDSQGTPTQATPGVPEVLPTSQSASTQSGPTIHIGDEFGTAKRNLPPVSILVTATIGILIVVGIFSFLQRAKPQAAGSLDSVTAVQLPGQNAVLVALTFTLRSSAEKTLWVHGVQGKVVTASGEHSEDAVSTVDFDRYYQAFPALKESSQPPLAPEDKLQPGQAVQRTVMVGFQINLDEFNQRRSVSVVIQPYDQPLPVVLTK